MSVTFSGAFTFSGGGLTLTLAPPPTQSDGWFVGGATYSIVQRITFANDTVTPSQRGSLPYIVWGGAGVGTDSYGWFGGGYANPGGIPFALLSTLNRITYAADTATTTARGSLSIPKFMGGTGAVGNSTYGWFNGGQAFSPVVRGISNVDRMTYATDTAATSSRGPLSSGRYSGASVGNSNYGWCAGGYRPGSGMFSLVDRIDYINDTATASVRGPLSSSIYQTAGSSDGTTYGWIGGGSSPNTTVVNRIDYSNDTGTTSIRGPLTLARYGLSATGNRDYGWFAAGDSAKSTVDRITYANDTATSSARAPMILGLSWMMAASGMV